MFDLSIIYYLSLVYHIMIDCRVSKENGNSRMYYTPVNNLISEVIAQ